MASDMGSVPKQTPDVAGESGGDLDIHDPVRVMELLTRALANIADDLQYRGTGGANVANVIREYVQIGQDAIAALKATP